MDGKPQKNAKTASTTGTPDLSTAVDGDPMPAAKVKLGGELRANGIFLPRSMHHLLKWILTVAPSVWGFWRLRSFALDVTRCRFRAKELASRLCDGQTIWIRPNDLIGRHIFYHGIWE